MTNEYWMDQNKYLSLLGYPGLKPIDPVFALPVSVVQRLKLKAKYSTK